MGLLAQATSGLLSGLWKRSLENPSTPLSAPDDWLFDALGSYRASSGVQVNHQTALTHGPIWRGVSLLSADVAKLPLCVYRRRPDGGKDMATTDARYRLLRYNPCPELKAFDWLRALMAQAILQGNSYSYIQRNGRGQVLELWPLNPIRTYPIRENGVLQYVHEFSGAQEAIPKGAFRKIPREDMFHIRGLSFDGLAGFFVVTKAREGWGLSIAIDTYCSVFFRNHAKPHVVLEFPNRLDPVTKDRLRDEWERMHAGLENAHRTAILDQGLKATPLQINARDAQLIEVRKFQLKDVANWLGLPPHLLGDDSKSGYNSLEQEQQNYLDQSLDPWLTQIEAEAHDKLLTEAEKDEDLIAIQFDRKKLIRANAQARAQYYTSALQGGWLNRDEVRDEEGLNPIPDGSGQEFLVALNMGTAGGADGGGAGNGADKEEPPAQDQEEDSDRTRLLQTQRALLFDAVARMVRRLGKDAERANTPARFMAWLESFDAAHRATITGALSPFATSASDWLLEAVRSAYSRLAERSTVRDLPEGLSRLGCDLAVSLPLQATLLYGTDARQKAGKPVRTTEQALDILARIPDQDEEGHVAITLPLNEKPGYSVTPDDLAASVKKIVKLKYLSATQALVERKKLSQFIKNPERYQAAGADTPGLPRDRPYVVKYGGALFIHGGHHRTMGNQLLGVTKQKVYLYKAQ
jgi:HK97 family phage portal protein